MDLLFIDILEIFTGKFNWKKTLIRQAGFWIGIGTLLGGGAGAVGIIELGWPWYLSTWAVLSSLVSGATFVVMGYWLPKKLT